VPLCVKATPRYAACVRVASCCPRGVPGSCSLGWGATKKIQGVANSWCGYMFVFQIAMIGSSRDSQIPHDFFPPTQIRADTHKSGQNETNFSVGLSQFGLRSVQSQSIRISVGLSEKGISMCW
jgi:hypothetical protein